MPFSLITFGVWIHWFLTSRVVLIPFVYSFFFSFKGFYYFLNYMVRDKFTWKFRKNYIYIYDMSIHLKKTKKLFLLHLMSSKHLPKDIIFSTIWHIRHCFCGTYSFTNLVYLTKFLQFMKFWVYTYSTLVFVLLSQECVRMNALWLWHLLRHGHVEKKKKKAKAVN